MRSTNCALIAMLFVVLGILWLAGNVALCADIVVEENITYGSVHGPGGDWSIFR